LPPIVGFWGRRKRSRKRRRGQGYSTTEPAGDNFATRREQDPRQGKAVTAIKHAENITLRRNHKVGGGGPQQTDAKNHGKKKRNSDDGTASSAGLEK